MTSERFPEPDVIARFPEITRGDETGTSAIAKILAREIYGGLTIILSGGLGAGKTTFTRYLAEAIGVVGVKSPTFATESIHRIPGRDFGLVHADLYRFDSVLPGSDTDLQFEEYLSGPRHALLVVEWGDRWSPPSRDRWDVDISMPDESGRRSFALSARGMEALSRMARAYERVLC
jgi:tRNA threonylcarbamoyl adenosine modification protein YjeE